MPPLPWLQSWLFNKSIQSLGHNHAVVRSQMCHFLGWLFFFYCGHGGRHADVTQRESGEIHTSKWWAKIREQLWGVPQITEVTSVFSNCTFPIYLRKAARVVNIGRIWPPTTKHWSNKQVLHEKHFDMLFDWCLELIVLIVFVFLDPFL